MTTADAAIATPGSRSIGGVLRIGLVAVAVLLPLASIARLVADPATNVHLHDNVQHFVITSNVAIVAAAVALLVTRAALDLKHYGTLLVALGFMSMAGIFAVHGLSTPGVLIVGELKEIGASMVVAASAQLSLLIPAAFFAARYTPIRPWLQQRVRADLLVGLTILGLLVYAIASLGWPAELGAMYVGMTGMDQTAYSDSDFRGSYRDAAPWLQLVALAVLGLFGFAGWRQWREHLRSGLPTHGALAIAYVLLAEAQIAMFAGDVWSLLFWSYHVLMGLAVVLAIGALFLELDRRRGLERFLPPNVVERVIVGDRLSLEGERRTATIFFTDLRGSTALAERATPEAAVATVNAYLRVMARAVIDAGGILDKFTGDGLMAIFGAMSDPASGARAAVRAALRMRTDLGSLNAERAARGEPTVGYGIGIHTGEVVLGAVGLPERSDYTAMGDTVNTAARMESLTKEIGVDAVVSDATATLIGAQGTRPLGDVTVKGKLSPIAVFALADTR